MFSMRSIRWLVVALGLVCVFGSELVIAQGVEISLADLDLKKTYIKTGVPLEVWEGNPPEAVSPLYFFCPNRRTTCTIHIELSVQFSTIPEGYVAGASVVIDDVDTDISPINTVGFDSTNNSPASNVSSFAWVKPGLTAGVHKLQVYLFLTNIWNDWSGTQGMAGSYTRTLTVNVYKP